MKYLIKIGIFIAIIFTFSCNNDEGNKKKEIITEKPELIIHCGVTIEKPINEIARIIEKHENCDINVTIGGSGNLYKSILSSKVGDMYVPGSKKYINVAINEKLVIDTVFVGKNRLSILVKKGNPKNIKPSFESLINEKYKIVLGNPESGSVGEETKELLNNEGIFDKVNSRVQYHTINSVNLTRAIKKGDADIIINWYATSFWDENKDYIEVLDSSFKNLESENIYIGLLQYSQYKKIAKKFMEYSSSKKGKEIFKKYGLY